MKRYLSLFLLGMVFAAHGEAQAIRRLPGFSKNSIPANDDGSSPLVQLPFPINFFGKVRDSGFVNNNGNITFDAALDEYTPFGLQSTQREIIAAFFADVDTRNPQSALVTYGEDSVDNRRAFGVNYFKVGYFASHADRVNTFQIVLIDRSDTGAGNFDVEFNYERIQWETGDASGGAGGLGGTPVVVGWANGTGEAGTSFELPGSMISGQFLDNGPRSLVFRRLNSPVLGRYLFRARNGQLSPGLSITSANTLPRAVAGQPYSFILTAAGGSNPYRWTLTPDPGSAFGNLALDAAGNLSGTPGARGTYEATVSVSSRVDAAEETVSQRVLLEVDAASLTIDSRACPLTGGAVGSYYRTVLRATGGPGPYLWSWSTPVSGLTLEENGLLTGMPDRAGTFTFQLRAAGPPGSELQPAIRNCSITIRPPAAFPSVQSCPEEFGTMGVPYEGTALASGGDAPWRWLALGALPNGITLSPEGTLSGIPRVAGVYPYALRATDRGGRIAETSCKLTIGGQALTISTACPLPVLNTGDAVSTRFTLSGGQAPYLWTVSGGLPPGVVFHPDGTLSGSANAAGSWQFLLVASDKNGHSGAKLCALSVLRAPLSVASCPLPEAQLGQPYAQSLNAVGGVAPFRWIAQTAPPQGLSLLSDGRLAGTPTAPGDVSFRVLVTDANGLTNSQDCRLFVRPQVLQIQRPCPISDAQVGSFYREYALAEGGVPPYRWRVEGSLPAGVVISEAGVFSGTATTPGEYPFTLILEDFRNAQARQGCSVTAKIPTIPDLRIVSGAGTSNVPVDLTLAKPYSLPITGDLVLTSEAATGAADSEVNKADPAVQLLPGGRRVRFEIPAGTRSVRYRLASLGTVAAQHRVGIERLTVAGQTQVAAPAPAVLELPRTAPSLSDACYTLKENVLHVQLTGQTPTRELTALNLELNGKTLYETPIVPLSYDYFSNPASVRSGGTFRLDVPVAAEAPGYTVEVTTLKAVIANRVGASAARDVRRCN
ncbi:MAG TPA: putative Ig domain-containing protein [Bryobacteraceae bacterium]|nr:putative Ig domain-containing protein [Bryobacteraceae bacterium]